MIALDTNILARFYVDDPNDPEAVKQRSIARRILSEMPALSFVRAHHAQPPGIHIEPIFYAKYYSDI